MTATVKRPPIAPATLGEVRVSASGVRVVCCDVKWGGRWRIVGPDPRPSGMGWVSTCDLPGWESVGTVYDLIGGAS